MSVPLHQRLDREAADLWTRPRAEARDTLIVHYDPFAEQLAKGYVKRNPLVEFDDARQEARIALMDCVDRFDPNDGRGATFTTFAGWRIRNAMVDAARANDWVPAKVRAADKGAEESSLPLMLPMNEAFDRAEQYREFVESDTDLAELLDRMDQTPRRYLEWLLDTGWDIDHLARREGTSVNQIALCVKWAIERASLVPVAA